MFRTYDEGRRTAGPVGRVRAPGPRSASSGSAPTTASSATTGGGFEVRPRRAGPAAHCGSTSSTRPPAGALYVATGRRPCALPRRTASSSSERRTGLGTFAIGHQGIASDASGTRVRRHRPRPLRRARPIASASTRRPTRSAQVPLPACTSDRGGALYFARGGLLFRKESGRVVEFGRPRGLPTRRDDRRRADRRRRPALGAHGQAALRSRARARSGSSAHDDGPSGVERGRPPRLRRPRRRSSCRPSRAWRHGTDGVWQADRTARGAPRRHRARRHSSIARARCGSACSAAGLARRLGHGEFTNWTAGGRPLARGRLGDRAAEGAAGPGPLWVGTEQGLNRIDPSPARYGVFLEIRRPRRQHRQRARRRPGRQRLGGLLAGRSDALCARRKDPPLRRRGCASDQFRVAAIHVRPDGEVWVGAVNGLYRLPAGSRGPRSSASRSGGRSPTTCAASPRIRPGFSTPRASRDPPRSDGPAPRKFTARRRPARGLRLLDRASRPTAAS